MLNPAKASRSALIKAAESYIVRQKYAEAERLIAGVLAKDAEDAEALAMMAEALFFQGRPDIRYYMRAVCAAPDNLAYKEKFIQRCWLQKAQSFDPMTGETILHCLRSGKDVNCSKLYRFWHSHLMQMPEFKGGLGQVTDFRLFLTPYFLLGLQHLVVANADFELFVTGLRKSLLDDMGIWKFLNAPESLEMSKAIAFYAFHTDYILDATPEEDKKISVLRERIEAGDTSENSISMLACYMPLYKLSNAGVFPATPTIQLLIETQVHSYESLKKTASVIEALTPISEGVSSEVQKQYEEFPYPRWHSFSAESLSRGWKESAGAWDNGVTDHLRQKGTKILIAGCGTGQEACLTSALFPEAEILAVDLSRTSLAYGMNKACEYGLKNITFRQADILKLDSIDQKFDYITTSGVLHHLENPEQGWKVLRDLLKPGGIMMVSLYSKIARKYIMQVQDIARRKGFTGSAESMKEFRRQSPELLGKDLLAKVQYVDYFNLNMYRDLLFHAQEHNYDLTDIAAMLDNLRMTFLGFNLPPQVKSQYAKQFPNDASKTNLKNWHEFELKNPTTFQAMYQFWCKPDNSK